MSCLTLALQLLDVEERVPWEMVSSAEGLDWSLARPFWLQNVQEGGSHGPYEFIDGALIG